VGLVYGVAGFCSGPLLGAVLTVAGASADPALGAALLFTYALGTAAPLFAIAWLWDRFDLGRKGWHSGRELRLGPLRVHTINLIAGTLIVLLGASFIAFQGGSALSEVYADLGLEEIGLHAQIWVSDHLGQLPDAVWLAPIALVVIGVWLWRRSRGRPHLAAMALPNGAGGSGVVPPPADAP
jgi:hypothetical protein